MCPWHAGFQRRALLHKSACEIFVQADAADASGSGGWFGFGGSATSAAAGGAAAGGAAAGGAAAAGGWFGGLFGGGIGFCCILSQARLDGRFAGDWWPFVSLASAAGSSGEDKGQAQPVPWYRNFMATSSCVL